MSPRGAPDVSENTLDWLARIFIIALVPIGYIMYRHFRSLRARYPAVLPDGALTGLRGEVKGKHG